MIAQSGQDLPFSPIYIQQDPFIVESNNEDPGQTAQMRRLAWIVAIRVT